MSYKIKLEWSLDVGWQGESHGYPTFLLIQVDLRDTQFLLFSYYQILYYLLTCSIKFTIIECEKRKNTFKI